MKHSDEENTCIMICTLTTLQGNFDIHTNNEHSHCVTENRLLQTGWLRSQRNWCRVTHNLLLILDHLNLHLYMRRLTRFWVFHYNRDDARSGITQWKMMWIIFFKYNPLSNLTIKHKIKRRFLEIMAIHMLIVLFLSNVKVKKRSTNWYV